MTVEFGIGNVKISFLFMKHKVPSHTEVDSSGTCGILVLFLIWDCQRSSLGRMHVRASRLANQLSAPDRLSALPLVLQANTRDA